MTVERSVSGCWHHSQDESENRDSIAREAMIVTLSLKVDTMLPRFDAGHEHGKQTNEFAVHDPDRKLYAMRINDSEM
jgi:hypothetical protein